MASSPDLSSLFSSERFDEIRAAHPGIGFGVYALEPLGGVTLEAHMPDGRVFTFRAATLADVLELAFPSRAVTETAPEDDLPPEDPPATEDIFG